MNRVLMCSTYFNNKKNWTWKQNNEKNVKKRTAHIEISEKKKEEILTGHSAVIMYCVLSLLPTIYSAANRALFVIVFLENNGRSVRTIFYILIFHLLLVQSIDNGQ